MISAVIAAAGRLEPGLARAYGTDIKALARIGGRTLLGTLVDALRAVPEVGRITVVGPRAVQDGTLAVDAWLDERESGEENVIAALRSAGGGRCLACAADLPFVTAGAIAGLLRLAAPGVQCAYPIFTRAEFLGAFPGARSSFATLADGEWTGGSALVLDADLMLRNEALIKRAFAARKSLLTLASLLGPALALRYATRRLTVDGVQARLSALIGGTGLAVRGADPALAMDCDEPADFEYARRRFAEATA